MTAPPQPPRRRPRLFWSAVVVAALVLGAGVLVAALGYAETSGPDGVVHGYFDALARSDAASALAFGDVPDGPHTLLTDTVLKEQERIAPIQDLHVTGVRRTGDTALVDVSYTLAFPGDAQKVSDVVSVHQIGGDWRLVHVAIATQLEIVRALDRATIVGAAIPVDTTLLFPGAVPVAFDTPYLSLVAARDYVPFSAGSTTQVIPEVSDKGDAAVATAVQTAIEGCLSAKPDLECPQPSERYVPGSVRGTLVGSVESDLTVSVGDGDAGLLDISGTAQVNGTYRKLGFDNRATSHTGKFSLPFHATAYATSPVLITWARPT